MYPTKLEKTAPKTFDANVEQTVKEDTKPKQCETCGKEFKSPLAYSRHLLPCKSAVNECHICETKFEDAEQLKLHTIDQHDGNIWVCMEEGCYSSFATKKGLQYHSSTVHSAKTFNCSACNESYPTQEELSMHKKSSSHKSKTKKSPCPGCSKMFNIKHDAVRHFDSCCPFNPDRQVKCKVCNTGIGRAIDFLKHLREKHNCTSNYMCTRCLLDMPTKKSLEEHLLSCKVKVT